MKKVYHYWMYNNNIRKETYEISSINEWNITLSRKTGTRIHHAIISSSNLNKWNGVNLWLEEECDDKVAEYYKVLLQDLLEKAIKSVKSYEERIENFTGKIVEKES